MTTSLGTLELSALLSVARLGDDAYGLAVRQDLSERGVLLEDSPAGTRWKRK